jgi:hypothetical protein
VVDRHEIHQTGGFIWLFWRFDRFSKAGYAVLKLCLTGRLMEVVWLLATYPDDRSRSD